jgi:hypothetical protein
MIFPYFCTPKSNAPVESGQKAKRMNELSGDLG